MLQGKPPCSDLFGVKGREWLAGLKLSLEDRESVDAGIRQIEFLDREIAAVEKLIAQQALSWPEIRRLMTVPGVNLIRAASFIAAVGDPYRFLTSRKLVAYLGLDPRVKQSGDGPARSGRISKRGSPSARWALVEAAWTTVLQPRWRTRQHSTLVQEPTAQLSPRTSRSPRCPGGTSRPSSPVSRSA